MASGTLKKNNLAELLYEGSITADGTAISVPCTGIKDATVIMIEIAGGAAYTILPLVRTSATYFYGGGSEITAATAQVISAYMTNNGDTITLAAIRNAAGGVPRTIKKIFKLY